jgi:hypothetical protein
MFEKGCGFREHLKEDWKHSWRWLQTQLGAAIAFAPTLYDILSTVQLPPQFKWPMTALGILVVLNAIRKKKRRDDSG